MSVRLRTALLPLLFLAPTLSPAEAQSGTRPQDVIITYYNALGHKNYAAAYALWDRQGQNSGKSYAAFKNGFAQTYATYVAITGPVRIEGAAGSLYATVPVKVTAQLKNGQQQSFCGNYVVRKNNTGGSAASQVWRIDRATLR
ncbi:hypothetical protein GO986_20515 [Deinococcus sp. HMF7620]|uniref:SnoaL-like domain-containing protein n=1 Tax=Deinococcus arboris TaxID=2682977 RepID=A0A7C9HUL4_9DEIO|nr:hypothetical protein [Deinococcus arboris]MVN89127.1 hypothetical protein [Deinococcus arboris]